MNRSLITTAAVSVIGLLASVSLAEEPANQPTTQPTDHVGEALDQASKALAEAVAPESAKVSAYGVAYDFAWRIKPYYDQAGWNIDVDEMMEAIKDALAEKPPKYSETEINEAVTQLQNVLTEKEAKAQEEMKAANEAAIANDAKYLEENKAKPSVTTTASGLQIEHLKEGDGPYPKPTDTVKVHYKGTFTNGKPFDSSYDRNAPTVLGVSQFIPGFTEGLTLTKVGGKSRLVIPYELAYGESGRPPVIPPKAALIFEIEVLEIVQPDATQPDAPTTDEPATP